MCQSRVVIKSDRLFELLAEALEAQGAQVYRSREAIENWEHESFVILKTIGPGFTINIDRHRPGGSPHGTHAISLGWPIEENGGIDRCVESVMIIAEER
jgi:hypothetical protein